MCPSKKRTQPSSSSHQNNKKASTTSWIPTTLNDFIIQEGDESHSTTSEQHALVVGSSSSTVSSTSCLNQSPQNPNTLVDASTFQAQFRMNHHEQAPIDLTTLSEEEHSHKEDSTPSGTSSKRAAPSSNTPKKPPTKQTPPTTSITSYTPFKSMSSRFTLAPTTPQYQNLPKPPKGHSFTPPKAFGIDKAEKYKIFFQWLLEEIYPHDQCTATRRASVDNLTAQLDEKGESIYGAVTFQKTVYHLIKNFRRVENQSKGGKGECSHAKS
ncbi:hypothetical protein C9374_003891 [Naegleria lovaniensis]|uniref:Uncharacterized protein n=1 Tax=Naegleria lovaniensis TaxID=51637 RepID=A0AA88H8Q4_NAELO|nr:uncharacterized protein C9374_003891 [Naegleria lovaniensis]KAG2394127.1 hypothetical protein C9374_003891 [Naegleria lovaniensis]